MHQQFLPAICFSFHSFHTTQTNSQMKFLTSVLIDFVESNVLRDNNGLAAIAINRLEDGMRQV